MKKQPWLAFQLAGVDLSSFGELIPSPLCELQLMNSEISSFTSWTLSLTIGGDSKLKMNAAAFEALLYSAAQSAYSYENASGIPVNFSFGWIDQNGQISEYTSYQGYTLKFEVSTNNMFLNYRLTGYASIALKSSMPVLNIPALTGIVQPSAVVEAIAKATKADTYYQLDIDHTDSPTLISHGAITTSFSNYVRGSFDGKDDYNSFPGLLKLAKSYNNSREATGLKSGYKSMSQILNNRVNTPVSDFMKKGLTDSTVQSSSYSFWIDEPSMTHPGTIHFKNNASLNTMHTNDTLEYGTANTNVLAINGSYNGVAYNMTDMSFASIGFAVDGSGNAILEDYHVVNSWSSSLAGAFQTVNIINDINALASQFSGTFKIDIPGNVKEYTIAQPISLIVMSGNTLSPISGIYSIVAVSHTIGKTFVTSLEVQRLVMSSANQVASQQGIYVNGSSSFRKQGAYDKTSNVISANKVDFGTIYPTFEHISIA